MSKKPKCQCCEISVADTNVEYNGQTVAVSTLCWKQWLSKPNGQKRMLQMVRAHKAMPGTRGHDIALLRMYIEGNYNEYGGDDELAALDRVEASHEGERDPEAKHAGPHSGDEDPFADAIRAADAAIAKSLCGASTFPLIQHPKDEE